MADRLRFAVVTAGLLLLPACTSFADTAARPTTTAPSATAPSVPATGPTASPTPTPAAPVGAAACPSRRAAPDPDRPVVDLDFRLADDLGSVTGSETVVFTPDLATDELVFRLVPNAPDSAAGGNRLTVDRVRGDDVAGSGYTAADAEKPGGLFVVRLDHELPAGESTEVVLDFTLSLGSEGFDRFGTDGELAWWGSGAPLLAWEPGRGWARDPFVDLIGETAVSTAADTTISVSAPAELTVLMTGDRSAPSAVRAGRRTWRSTEPVARDVSVAVGPFDTAERTTDGGVRVRTGTLPGDQLDAATLADRTVAAVEDLADFLGPFPFRTLTVTELPDYGGGIEYPSAILQASPSRMVLVHEVAHMWFYGMVGNSQFRDPWLDEAFASWAEAVVDPTSADQLEPALGVVGDVGAAMDDYPNDTNYFARVYGKGAAALLEARDAAGAQRFDAAVRCYADATAWSIATPDDLAVALADLQPALDALLDAGAIDEEDLTG